MIGRFRTAAFAACAALGLAAEPALADPALWVMKSKTSTIYLFGTVHALKADQTWRTPVVDKAFRDAGELWMEVPVAVTPKGSAQPYAPEEVQRMAQLTATLGMTTQGPPLSERLTPAEAAQLTAVAPIPKERLDRMRPWLVSVLVQNILLQQLGLAGDSAADLTLDQEAVAAGKPVKGFESIEQQVHFFADLTPDEELGWLRLVLTDGADFKQVLEATERDWASGDEEGLAKLVVDRMRRAPQVYRRLVLDRNARWVPQIETMLNTPGVRFIAVGAGHLVGSDGVIALLRKDGWQIDRIQ